MSEHEKGPSTDGKKWGWKRIAAGVLAGLVLVAMAVYGWSNWEGRALWPIAGALKASGGPTADAAAEAVREHIAEAGRNAEKEDAAKFLTAAGAAPATPAVTSTCCPGPQPPVVAPPSPPAPAPNLAQADQVKLDNSIEGLRKQVVRATSK